MRGLTILQPYLGMKIIHALFGPECDRDRTVEFRTHSTNIREVVALRAGAHHIPCLRCPVWWSDGCDLDWPRCHEQPEAQPAEWARSAIVAIAELVDCRETDHARDKDVPGYTQWNGMYSWIFRDLRALPEPVACKPKRGAQTWFTLPEDVEAEVLRQIAREGRRA